MEMLFYAVQFQSMCYFELVTLSVKSLVTYRTIVTFISNVGSTCEKSTFFQLYFLFSQQKSYFFHENCKITYSFRKEQVAITEIMQYLTLILQ